MDSSRLRLGPAQDIGSGVLSVEASHGGEEAGMVAQYTQAKLNWRGTEP